MLTTAEFESILNDPTKPIAGDIFWKDDENHSPSVEFRAEITSNGGWPLFVCGSFNRLVPALTYALILKGTGRIYALDMGKAHHNPQCDSVGETHKHRWTEAFRDKQAYEPDDITAPVDDVITAWSQFCTEARIQHKGTMASPPAHQQEFFT